MRSLILAAFLTCLAAGGSAFAHEPDIYKAYEGPEVPVEQQVILKIPEIHPPHVYQANPKLRIVSVDGRNIGNWFTGAKRADEFRFLPGKRVIQFQMQWGRLVGYSNLWFVGVAGKTYSTHLEFDRWNFKLWINDDATGQPVGGIHGASDEPGDSSSKASDPSGG